MKDLNTIDEIIADLAEGKMVIMMDDEDRENEGDLIIAADKITADAVNFMATQGRGLICLPITEERADLLQLWPQSIKNNAKFSTNFTVSIEAAEGVTTGISAHDRAQTIKAATAKNAKATDIVKPGHIFPIVAEAGGVLTRAGHTEASCDLARLAGFSPAAVIVEILNEDGTMARRPDLEKFAEKYDLKVGTIADLISYRLEREKTVTEVANNEIQLKGQALRLYVYEDGADKRLHYAVVKGNVLDNQPVFVRVHVQNTLTDLFGLQTSERTWSLDEAIDKLLLEDNGVVVVLTDDSHHQDIIASIQGMNEPMTKTKNQALRTYGIGAQILVDLGVKEMRLLSSPMKFSGMSGFNLKVSEYITN